MRNVRMYTLEEYKKIQNDIEYQRLIVNRGPNNILKIHNQSKEIQLLFMNVQSCFSLIKFPTEEVCLYTLDRYANFIRYINNPTKEMIWKSIKINLNNIKYVDIVKHPEIFEFYQENYKYNDKLTIEKFKLVNYDLDYQKKNYNKDGADFNQILNPSSEIINFYIDNEISLDEISLSSHLTESHQNKILDKAPYLFRFFKYPTEDITYKAVISKVKRNILYVDLDKYPEVYNYWRLANI